MHVPKKTRSLRVHFVRGKEELPPPPKSLALPVVGERVGAVLMPHGEVGKPPHVPSFTLGELEAVQNVDAREEV